VEVPQIVIDTNVVVAGLRSKRGSAHRLLQAVGSGVFGIHLSVPLVLEYEAVLYREDSGVPRERADAVIDFHCSVAVHHAIFFLWRPILPDPKDDMVLELAASAKCDSIVTYNVRDFAGAERFAIQVIEPAPFLQRIGVLP
jgi:predicted nucleic acid-binding protein